MLKGIDEKKSIENKTQIDLETELFVLFSIALRAFEAKNLDSCARILRTIDDYINAHNGWDFLIHLKDKNLEKFIKFEETFSYTSLEMINTSLLTKLINEKTLPGLITELFKTRTESGLVLLMNLLENRSTRLDSEDEILKLLKEKDFDFKAVIEWQKNTGLNFSALMLFLKKNLDVSSLSPIFPKFTPAMLKIDVSTLRKILKGTMKISYISDGKNIEDTKSMMDMMIKAFGEGRFNVKFFKELLSQVAEVPETIKDYKNEQKLLSELKPVSLWKLTSEDIATIKNLINSRGNFFDVMCDFMEIEKFDANNNDHNALIKELIDYAEDAEEDGYYNAYYDMAECFYQKRLLLEARQAYEMVTDNSINYKIANAKLAEDYYMEGHANRKNPEAMVASLKKSLTCALLSSEKEKSEYLGKIAQMYIFAEDEDVDLSQEGLELLPKLSVSHMKDASTAMLVFEQARIIYQMKKQNAINSYINKNLNPTEIKDVAPTVLHNFETQKRKNDETYSDSKNEEDDFLEEQKRKQQKREEPKM